MQSDLYLTTDDSQCVVWVKQQLTYIGKECREMPHVLGQVYGKYAKRLDLSYNSLTSLEGLQDFTLLEELVLDNNCLGDDVHFPVNTNLHTISLNKNRLKHLESLLSKLRTSFPNLRYLSLLGNDACPDQLSDSEKDEEDYRRYRFFVLHSLPNLTFLDSSRVNSRERNESTRVGDFMRVIRPTAEAMDRVSASSGQFFSGFTSQPLVVPESDGIHRGAFGRLKYRYTGNHSEGNRFIRNHEL